VISVADRVEIRRLHRAERVPIKEIARRMVKKPLLRISTAGERLPNSSAGAPNRSVTTMTSGVSSS
jgi:hypothetical protein